MKKYTLITGANSGIGYALSYQFALHRHDLIIVGRNKEKLLNCKEQLCSIFPDIDIQVIVQDLAHDNAGSELYKKICAQKLMVQYIVNNAGIGFVGKYEDIPFTDHLQMMTTNMTSLASICHYFIPMLKSQEHCGILNVASNGAFHPGPYTANYYASKAYVLHLSQALRSELKKDGIHVSTLCPGATISDFCRKAGKSQIAGSMTAEKVAQIAYRKFMRDRAVIIPGIQNNISLVVPKYLRSQIVGLTQQRLSKK